MNKSINRILLLTKRNIKEILRDLEFASGVFDYTLTPDRCTFLKNYITLQWPFMSFLCYDGCYINFGLGRYLTSWKRP